MTTHTPRRARARRTLLATAAALAAIQALAFAPGALASTTVIFDHGTLDLAAAPGIDNNVTVDALPGKALSIVDSADTVEVLGTDPTCRDGDDRHEVVCGPLVDLLRLNLGDGDDTATVNAGVASQLNGGPGDDHLDGGGKGDSLDGGTGSDTLAGRGGVDTVTYAGRSTPIVAVIGGAGGAAGEGDTIADDVENLTGGNRDDQLTGDDDANTLDGRAGSDLLDGRVGPDRLVGGDGLRDRVSYAGRSASVTASLSGLKDDGEAGEGDTIDSSVEDITGGDGSDLLTGDADPNHLDGGSGDDRLEGDGGPDTLGGGAGADIMDGGDGIDAVTYRDRTAPVTVTLLGGADYGEAGEGDDVHADVNAVHGGDGDDHLTGSNGNDLLFGHGGDDVLSGLGGADALIGGEGANALDGGLGVDVCDDAGPGCEQLTDSDPFPDPGPIGPLPL